MYPRVDSISAIFSMVPQNSVKKLQLNCAYMCAVNALSLSLKLCLPFSLCLYPCFYSFSDWCEGKGRGRERWESVSEPRGVSHCHVLCITDTDESSACSHMRWLISCSRELYSARHHWAWSRALLVLINDALRFHEVLSGDSNSSMSLSVHSSPPLFRSTFTTQSAH